ncbi:MAG: hydroxymethylbilane synthase, partial [Thermoleophilia bacterium]
LMTALEGGCQGPIGAHAQVVRGEVTLEAYLGSLDGSQTVRMSHAGLAGDAAAVGTELAARMLAAGGEEILAEVRAALE